MILLLESPPPRWQDPDAPIDVYCTGNTWGQPQGLLAHTHGLKHKTWLPFIRSRRVATIHAPTRYQRDKDGHAQPEGKGAVENAQALSAANPSGLLHGGLAECRPFYLI